MASSEAGETKTIITGLLISSPLKCTIQQLCKDFKNTVGYPIPFQKLGFRSVEEYLRSIPDTVRIYSSGPLAEVEAVVKPKSAHINELVAKQKKSAKPSQKKGRIKQYHTPKNRCSLPVYTFRPLSLPHFGPSSSHQNFHNQNNISFNSLNSRPTLNVPSQEQSCKSSSSLNDFLQEPSPSSSLSSQPSYKEKHDGDDEKRKKENGAHNDKTDKSSESSDYDDYETTIPHSVQKNLSKLIQQFPEGLDCSKIPTEYRKVFNKRIDYEKFNYRSLIEMCSDLPEIFRYVQASSDEFILYHKNRPEPCLNQNDVAVAPISEDIGGDVLSELSKIDWATGLNFIPPDVLHLSERIPRFFPSETQAGDYLDISVGEIYDISKFWVYLTFGNLPSLMEDLQTFFNNQRNKYLIPEFLLNEGLYCTTVYAGQYHRAVIVDLLPALPGYVRVLFVDYGTVGNISSKEIWYLPKQFGRIPCQAIRTRLSNIYPIYENRTWSVQAVNRFKQLITNVPLVAEVIRIDEDDHVLEIYLADISNENNIFYINDVLVEEGLALYGDQEQKKSLVDPNCSLAVKYIHLYPDFTELESGNAPTVTEMDYLVTKKVPLHHFLPQYFDIYYDENIQDIEKQHEIFNRELLNIKMKPLEDEFDYSKDFDFTLFPDEIVDDIKGLVRQEVASANAKTEIKEPIPKTEQKSGEATKDESVRQYCCNKKRISELRSGGSEKSDTFSDLSSNLEVSLDDLVPLNNTFHNMHLNNSDLSVINNVTKLGKSTNPFIGDEDMNPFRRTNPFLNDLEEAASSKDLLEMYAKPLEKKVNNLNSSNQSSSKVNKEANVGNSFNFTPKEEPRPIGQRVRTPPGFHGVPQNSTPNVPPWGARTANVISPPNFNGFYNNPYCQRFPQFNNMFHFTVNQPGMGMMPNFPPPCYPNQYPFGFQYQQQFSQNFVSEAPPPMGNPMGFRPR